MNKLLHFFIKAAFLTSLLVLTSCGSLTAKTTPGLGTPIPTEKTIQLATPVAMQPAAGICAEGQGEVVIMRVNPDIPDPRCLQVHSDQHLTVFNGLETSLEVTLGELTATIEPGGEHTFDLPLGQILLPGVHILETSSCCGGEILLKEDSNTEMPVATEIVAIIETVSPETQGHLEFPYISADAGNFILQAGEEIVIAWEDAPVEATLYEIKFIHSDAVEENLTVVSTNPADGIMAVWLVPERVSGHLEGVARYSDGKEVRSGCCAQVFTGDLPPEGICSLLVHGISIQNLYQEPSGESPRIAGIAPGIYLEVLERTVDNWYLVKTDNGINSGTSETVNISGWINGQENVGLHGPCEDIPFTED